MTATTASHRTNLPASSATGHDTPRAPEDSAIANDDDVHAALARFHDELDDDGELSKYERGDLDAELLASPAGMGYLAEMQRRESEFTSAMDTVMNVRSKYDQSAMRIIENLRA